MKNINHLPNQYKEDKKMLIKHNYLSEQFSDHDKILSKIKKVVKNNDFTLGTEVNIFENNFKNLMKSKYAIAVGSGTDAIFLSLRALGIGEGDEVITTSFTFYATIGAIVTTGAKPVYVDIGDDLNIDPDKIQSKITKKTKAILIVHWTGNICKMKQIKKIVKENKLYLVEDACHAICAKQNEIHAGNFGDFGCFSMHPLKNLNIWGDGGVVVTNKKKLAQKMYLMRNHGLVNRNENLIFGYNSRLDTIQAVVANHLLKKISKITNSRIKNAKYFDKLLLNIKEIQIPNRISENKQVFHLYSIMVKNRDKLINHLRNKKIDAKIHYPIPMHLQKASSHLNYKKGDLPKTEKICKSIISLPIHEYVTKKNIDYMFQQIKLFYK